jgi:hypothetical protein
MRVKLHVYTAGLRECSSTTQPVSIHEGLTHHVLRQDLHVSMNLPDVAGVKLLPLVVQFPCRHVVSASDSREGFPMNLHVPSP